MIISKGFALPVTVKTQKFNLILKQPPETLSNAEIVEKLKDNKSDYSPILAQKIRSNLTIADNQLIAFQTAIRKLCP